MAVSISRVVCTIQSVSSLNSSDRFVMMSGILSADQGFADDLLDVALPVIELGTDGRIRDNSPIPIGLQGPLRDMQRFANLLCAESFLPCGWRYLTV